MAIEFKLTGKKGARKFVKTVDISEESYRAINTMIEIGDAVNNAITGPSLKDAYDVFGGNCYKMLVTMAIEQMVSAFVHEMEDKNMLSVEGEEAFHRISSIILPVMCMETDGEEYTETLHFFNTDADDICDVMKECLILSVFNAFKVHLENMMRNGENIAGEAALLAIIYMVSDNEVNNEETLN